MLTKLNKDQDKVFYNGHKVGKIETTGQTCYFSFELPQWIETNLKYIIFEKYEKNSITELKKIVQNTCAILALKYHIFLDLEPREHKEKVNLFTQGEGCFNFYETNFESFQLEHFNTTEKISIIID